MKPVVLITTCKKNLNRIQSIEATWAKTLKHNNIPYYFVSSDLIEDIPLIKLSNFVESYEQLPTKTFLALEAVNRLNYTHIIKVDDDTFFDYNKLSECVFDYDYVGKFNEIHDAPTIHYYKCKDEFRKPKKPAKAVYAEGGFYILSNKAVKRIIERPISEFINTPDNYKGEDVLVGSILEDSDIKKLDLGDKNLSSSLNMDITYNYVTVHPVHFDVMPKLYNERDKNKILVENVFKNDYNRRDTFLKLYAK